MEAGLSDCLSGEALEKLEAGEGCVVRNPLPLIFDGEEIPRTEIHAGENIVVAGEELSVLHTLDGYERYFSTVRITVYLGLGWTKFLLSCSSCPVLEMC